MAIKLFRPAEGPTWLKQFSDSVESAFKAVMPAPFRVKDYTVATLPDAALYSGGVVFVTNETGGAVLAFSDGTDWRRVTDRAVVS